MHTSFGEDLSRLDKDLGLLSRDALTPPIDTERVTRYLALLYQRASLTGNLRQLEEVNSQIDSVIETMKIPGDLFLLKANLAFKLHRLQDVKNILERAPYLLHTPEGRTLQADLDFQEGRYGEARRGYEQLIEETRSWDSLARLAHFAAKMGEMDRAEQLYSDAEEELTAKEMRSFAWVQIQRGLLDMSHGRIEEARAHYDKARRAYPGYWTIDEHYAEMLGAKGQLTEAAALYEQVLSRFSKPEAQQALGEIYLKMGYSKQAESWLKAAENAYLQSVARGSVHYYHHLVDIYSGPVRKPAAALQWAERDFALRENFSTQAALAWALYNNGHTAKAVDMMRKSLSSGVVDAHIYSHAATIFRAGGHHAEAHTYAHRAEALNPNHHQFHVHH
jgi:tetratricopeptide (TPR) repeat protein